MAEPPTEFGKRRPVVDPSPSPPVKRSGHVALLLMGTMAVGGGAYALTSRQNCEPASSGLAAPASPEAAAAACSRSSWSGGHGGSGSGWWSHSSFYSGSSSSSGSASSGTSTTTRGGFGSFAHFFSGGG